MMIDKEQQVKNSFIYLLLIIASGVFNFVTVPIFTRILTPEDYGALALASICAIFVNGLANFGMGAAYNRNYFQYRDNRLKTAQLLYSILLFIGLNFFLLAGLTYAFRETLSKLIIGSARHGDFLFWTVCAQFFSGVSYYYLAYFKNSETAKDFVAYTIAGNLVNLVMSLFLVAHLRIGVIGIVYAQLCSGAIVFGILSYKFMTSLRLSLSKAVLLEALRISYPLTPRIFLGVIGTQSDKYMVGLLASVGGAGIYSIGQRVSHPVFTYMTAIQNVFGPQVFRRMFDLGEKEGGKAIGRYLTPFAYVSISVGLLVSLLSEEVISTLTPPAYHGAIDIVIILSMYYGFLFFGKLTGTQLIFTKKTHITSLLTVVSIGINVGLMIPFTLKWGAIGAAWATLLAGLISGATGFAVAQHYYEIRWEYRRVGAIFLTFFGSSLLMIPLREAQVDYPIRMAVKLVSLALYAYIGIKIRVISADNFALAKNVLGGFSFRKVKDGTA